MGNITWFAIFDSKSKHLHPQSFSLMAEKTRVIVAHGDGIGPEIMDATLKILQAAGADLDYDTIEIGENVFKQGYTSGIRNEDWDKLLEHKIFLKAPITTPQGKGYKSLNVSVRKLMSLYSNVRPTRAYHPYVHTNFPNMDLTIIRENEEDTYAGIEHQQTSEVVQCLKLISRPGCERIVRYAFEYAKANKKKKVTCMTKDNIMKKTDGLFRSVFNEIAREYPDIENEHYIIDIGSAFIADDPERFEVIVTLNLYGDIISDIAAQVAGSVGMCGSSNIGDNCAMFEAIHGSAPDIAGKDMANPSGLLNGALLMLNHLGQNEVAEKIHNAWLKTIEDGIHTGDIYNENHSKEKVGTKAFAQAVIDRLGEKPRHFAAAVYGKSKKFEPIPLKRPRMTKKLIGMDVFVDMPTEDPNELANKLNEGNKGKALMLTLITNRGAKSWPDPMRETFYTDHWRCRFKATDNEVSKKDLVELLANLDDAGIDTIKTENLYYLNGEAGFSMGQGE